ncbi:MAG: MotA/TolQ/ExbB proton channel family protein [Opitutaceae bacterium]
MIRSHFVRVFFLGLLLTVSARSESSLNDRMAAALLDYTARLEMANAELAETRHRIEDERVPLMDSIRQIEEDLVTLEAEVSALEAESARAEEGRQETEMSWESIVRNVDYLSRISLENLEGMKAALLPGEADVYDERIDELLETLARPSQLERAAAILAAPELQLERLRRQIGGHLLDGLAISEDDNVVRKGTYAFIGPEVLFASDDLERAGTVRPREGAPIPTVFRLPEWNRENVRALFQGERGTMPADASGGKALPLKASEESLLGHLRKGGVVGYVIMGLGLFALVTAFVKLTDLRRLSVDAPRVVRGVLDALASGVGKVEIANTVGSLRATTRELFESGLRHVEKPKALLEEHLSAFILRQRIDHERRLPLLAVIAAAAPLLGLLGTVVGMVKTFTLITIYGTGDAGKLSSGISEALITTELGLIVAIPTLVLHGYLSHRMQKNLALLEQYAVEFVTAAEENRTNSERGEADDR